MPEYKFIPPDKYLYKCVCGQKIELISDKKPQRLVKCWKCLKAESVLATEYYDITEYKEPWGYVNEKDKNS